MTVVSDVMTRDVLTVRSVSTLGEVARVMRKRNVGSVIVVDEQGAHVGVLSERELVDAVAASRDPDEGQAGSWMRHDHPTVDASATLVAASEAMRAADSRHLPVLDGDRIVGIISIKDILRAMM
jgi:CBS domain-containing protein